MRLFIVFTLIIFWTSAGAQVQNWIVIPDTLVGPEINLNLHQDSIQFFPGSKSYSLAFNQYNYLGPTILLNRNDDVILNVNNQINDTTNVHWHGLHVSPENDGGPHTMVMNGETWSPAFTVMNEAGTFWYHPHFHGKTGLHVLKGAAGFIIVRDDEEAILELPRKYGIDDFPIVVQSVQYDSLNQCMPLGMQDSTIFVNGSRANYGYEANLNVPAQVIRLRLLNGSGERTFNFGLSNNIPFSIIASEAGLLNQPVESTRIRISPGERYEILIDLSNLEGQIINLMSYASELPVGIQGGPTMEMETGPPMDSPINGIDFDVLHLHVGTPTNDPVLTIPSILNDLVPIPASDADITRSIVMSAESMMSMDGPFYFNGESFDMDVINYEIPINNTEIWEVTNLTMVAHPFHIHDVSFFIIDRDGNPAPLHEQGLKDVVFVYPQETVRFITKFEDFADSLTPYVYHCHILMHEDAGMMGQFVVMPDVVDLVSEERVDNVFDIYPNPFEDVIVVKAKTDNILLQLEILDASGKLVYSQFNPTSESFETAFLSPGFYTLRMRTKECVSNKKIIKK